MTFIYIEDHLYVTKIFFTSILEQNSNITNISLMKCIFAKRKSKAKLHLLKMTLYKED